jgi:hypothetical protein
MPNLQRVESPRAPVQPTMPFALQRKLIGEQESPVPIGGAAAASMSASAHPTPVVASLLASTDPPERRTLPVASAPRSAKAAVPVSPPAVAVQREEAEAPPAVAVQREGAEAPVSPPAVAVQREAEPMGETAPLLGGLGLAGPIAGDAESAPLLGGLGLAGPIAGDAETAAPPMLQATTELPIVSTPETPTPPPVVPLIADRPGPEPTAETHTRRLGLGAPLSGLPGGPSVQRTGSEAMPSTPVQRMFSGGTPPPPALQRIASPESPSNRSSLSPNLPSPPVPATRPAPPQVMVMRTAAASDPAMPVVSRAIDEPEPVYVPADPIPEAPLLGSRPMEIEYSADPAPEVRSFSGDAPTPESRSSAPDSPSVQRSPWSHMPKPVQRHQAFAAPRASVPPPSPPREALPAAPPSSGAVVQQQIASSAAPSWAPVAQRFSAPAPMTVVAAPAATAPEPAPVIPEAPLPQPVHQVVQRVATTAPAEGAGQAEATAPAAAAGAPAAADPGALLALLYEPLVRRLRADLRVDRERRGRLTDL